ncbi:MAG: cytochrome P450 [Verrucomicrobiales bacterium]|nr:cytochrome P450 [Verrucomicrobiales bacterium]
MPWLANWVTSTTNTMQDLLRRYPKAYARVRETLSRHPLPPGDYAILDVLERTNRDALRLRAERLGPIFKGIAWGELNVCIVGLERCRRFTQANRADLRVQTMELEHLIPKGFICAMEGEDHREIRKATYRAQRTSASCPHEAEQTTAVLESITAAGLKDYLDRAEEHGNSPDAFSTSLSGIATAMLIWVYFGAKPGTVEHRRIQEHLHNLGPYGLVWNPQVRQEKAFQAFLADLQGEAAKLRAGSGGLSKSGLLAKMAEDGSVDDSMLGNLIYQVEMGRSDMKNFFRWLTRHASDQPTLLDRIASEPAAPEGQLTLSESFVMETLRTDQSERLMRRALRDIVFDGFLIPRGATVRLCLWESHHGTDAFEEPHQFKPDRFVEGTPGNDVFAPFGVDHHQCPMGGLVLKLGLIFLRQLAQNYGIRVITPGPPVRGAYHWEPAPRFAVQLTKR